jgi:hypothetical protein
VTGGAASFSSFSSAEGRFLRRDALRRARFCFFRSSFLRKQESSSCSALISSRARASTRLRRAGYFLCLPKESNQRNAPQSIAPFVHPAQRVRVIGRVPLMAHPCATAECARSIAHPPAGPCRPLPPQCNGDPGKARAARSCAQKQRQERPLPPSAPSPALRAGEGKASLPLRSGETSAGLPMFAADAARRASHRDVASTSCREATEGGAFAVALGVPVSRGEGRTEKPEGSRAGAREFAIGQDAHRANPGLTSRTVAGGAAPGGHFSWLLLLTPGILPFVASRPASLFAPLLRRSVQAKRSDPRAGRARNTERTRCERIKSKVAGFPLKARGNDERSKSWIPAFAGMTRKNESCACSNGRPAP